MTRMQSVQSAAVEEILEAQLPQIDTASAMHIFLGSLTDRALH